MKHTGFTLIELLIVVLIIAILAAIAVPNFLEFQTRAKISRVKADMRSLVTALEAYYVDNNDFPSANSEGTSKWLKAISTPIAYITTAELPDPFTDSTGPNTNTTRKHIRYYGLNDRGMVNAASANGELILSGVSGASGDPRIYNYILFSHGPDRVRSKASNGSTFAAGSVIRNADILVELIYDPTNGTVHNAEIFRAGGEFRGDVAPSLQQMVIAH